MVKQPEDIFTKSDCLNGSKILCSDLFTLLLGFNFGATLGVVF